MPVPAEGPGPRTGENADVLVRAVVTSSLVGSALMHGMVAEEHLGVWLPAGLFFLGLQVVELGLALLAVHAWSRPVAVLVAVSGVLTLAVWLVSRTVGMPIGPPGFRVPEPVGTTDLACVVLEFASVVAAVMAWRRARVRPARTSWAAGAVAAALAITVWGGAPTVLGTGAGHHHGAGEASAEH